MARDTHNLWDALFGEIGRAVADVRQKVAVEPWFGRGADTPMSATRSVAEELGWSSKDDAEIDAAVEHDLGVLKEMGFDIDR